jgi:site-specific DNA-methyltransferase (adenine-specific)
MNKLLFGDNLGWLRNARIFPDASIDLVYLDPPFNSNADYNVLFKEETGEASQAQFHAFTDTWNWADAARTHAEFIDDCKNTTVVEIMDALHSFLRQSPMMAYLAMMAPRLVELHRVLKPTGSLYLHCDPTASHYLKIILDGIFGVENFLNENIWKRTYAHGGAKRFGPVHDVVLFYSKSTEYKWLGAYTPYSEDYVKQFFRFADVDGRKYRATILTGTGVRKGSSGKVWRGINPTKVGRHWAVPGYVRKLLPKPEVETVQEALDQLDALYGPKKKEEHLRSNNT